jgi:glycosyltransferase involved in cell wall biosynthesis
LTSLLEQPSEEAGTIRMNPQNRPNAHLRGLLAKVHPAPELNRWTKSLRAFVAMPYFDLAIPRARELAYPRISIVMPSFNQAAYIERSILSVLNQNDPNLQFIVIDGGSTDGTVEILRKYEAHLIWRSEPDRGQSDALNKGLALANGEIAGWQNSDDVYFPGALRQVRLAAARAPRAVLYSGTVASVDETDRVYRISKFIRPTALRLLHEGFVLSSQGVFWRREIEARVGRFDVDLHHGMDADFWLRVLPLGEAVFMPGLIGGFRVYPGTKTSAMGDRGTAEMHAIRMKYGVDDHTIGWELLRGALRASRLVQWMATTHV